MPSGLEAIDGDEVDAQLFSRQSVADRGAFMKDLDICGLEQLDVGARTVARRLD